jgi:hypothetical protein
MIVGLFGVYNTRIWPLLDLIHKMPSNFVLLQYISNAYPCKIIDLNMKFVSYNNTNK